MLVGNGKGSKEGASPLIALMGASMAKRNGIEDENTLVSGGDDGAQLEVIDFDGDKGDRSRNKGGGET